MGWKDEVMGVVNEMLAEVEDLKGPEKEGNNDAGLAYTRNALKGYARTLKAICGTAEDPPPAPTPSPMMMPNPFLMGGGMAGLTPELQHHLEVEKARSEFRKNKSVLQIEEKHDGDGVLIVGGPAENSFTTIDPGMPVGARTVIAGGVYKLTYDQEKNARRLVFDSEETNRVSQSLHGRKSGD